MQRTDAGLAGRALADVERDAADDGVSRGLARAALIIPVAGAVVIAIAALHRSTFLALVKEDGPIEWAQFAAFAVAAVLLGVSAVLLARRGDYVAAALIGLGALGFLGIAGEEISWGQRILGLETPESLAEINHQNELNLHNITSFPMQRIGNYLQLVIGGAGLVLPWLTRVRRPRVHNRLLRLLSPPLFLGTAFGLLFGYRAIRLVWDREVLTVVKYGEWPELMLACGILVYAFLLFRGLRRHSTTGTAAPATSYADSRRPRSEETVLPTSG